MAPKIDLVNVRVSVNGKEQAIKMEKGTRFENKGGIFTAGENNNVLKMTNYQLQAFKAMANNYKEEGESGIVLSKKDIQEAQQKYRNGGFVADMSEFLPEGYKIERPKLTSAENMVQAYVTNGNESQSATLKFSFIDTINNLVNKNNNTETTPTQKDIDSSLANKVISYKEGGNTHTITYNKDGKPATYKTTASDPDEQYIYDEKGRVIEVKYPTRTNYSKKYTYHPNGEIAQKFLRWNDGEPYTEITTYTPNGKITKEEMIRLHDGYNETQKKGHAIHQYSYDSKENLKYIITATNMDEPHESIRNYDIYPKYAVTKTEYNLNEWGYYAPTTEVLGFSDSADYEKSGLQKSYYCTVRERVISVDDDYVDAYSPCNPMFDMPETIYPWGNSLNPTK